MEATMLVRIVMLAAMIVATSVQATEQATQNRE